MWRGSTFTRRQGVSFQAPSTGTDRRFPTRSWRHVERIAGARPASPQGSMHVSHLQGDALHGSDDRLQTGFEEQPARHRIRPARSLHALRAELTTGTQLAGALRVAADAAGQAAEATRALRPKRGRARPLAERSVGHPDPGAVSFWMIVDKVAASAEKES